MTLARRVGDPRVSPVPPLWPVLALLLLAWRQVFSAERIMRQATELGAENEVLRGLAIIAYLFPELEYWLGTIRSRIPPWERTLAVPLAARKLVVLENMESVRRIQPVRWRVTGASRRGTAHVHSGVKNQDAIRYLSSSEGKMVVLAVADGHGSGLCFRSDAGSRLAAETALECLSSFARTVQADAPASAVMDRAQAVFAPQLTESWREKKPFTPPEWAVVAASEGWRGQEVLQRHPQLAYGSTIVAVLATQSHVLCLQLGDGDILFVDSEGNTHRPISKERRRDEKQTPSLWRRNAASEVQIHAENSESLPLLILAATDGCANSYRSDHEFLRIGRECLRMVGDEGFEGIEYRLNCLLDEVQTAPSGDDMTVGVISRMHLEETHLRKDQNVLTRVC